MGSVLTGAGVLATPPLSGPAEAPDLGGPPVSGMVVVIGELCLQAVTPAAKDRLRRNIPIKFAFFIFLTSYGKFVLHLAHEGSELLPEICLTSLTCFVGTSSKHRIRLLLTRRQKTIVRELGAQHGSSPATNFCASPPSAGATQIVKLPLPLVKASHLPSGDQSGEVKFP